MTDDGFHRGRVAAVPCRDYSEEETTRACEGALSLLGGLSRFVKPGMRVGIKCNLVSAMAPEKAATTSPALLSALCRMITDLGASVVLGDSPGGVFTEAALKNVYRTCGLEPLVREGVALNRDFSVKDAAFSKAQSIRTFTCTGWLSSCDVLINFSKLKSHGMMGMTGAVKNLFGTIPGLTKPEYHARFPQKRAFADMLVDLNEYFRPVLSLTDAVECMEGNGPTAGTPRHLGLLLASTSPYCLDMVGSACIGCGGCSRICPGRAITMRAGKPVINRRACIRCFCCQEFCPTGAMRVQRAPLAAVFRHRDRGEESHERS